MTLIPPALVTALADRYAIDRELGQGGMATVYLAEDLKHHRRVAIKVLKPELAEVLGAERFIQEIQTTAGLRHPHILPLYDSGRAEELLYYVMPYVEGESLRHRLDREKQLPLDDALQIAREVADALSYAHSSGIIHRDIKPGNILLESGHAVVADFGIAKAIRAAGSDTLTQTGLALGTPQYMSPEQAAGQQDLDGRTDLYALGCVLYEMLAGQPPFTGPTAESVVRQHMTAEPPSITQLRPVVPAEIAGVLQRALAKNPADRFNPVAQFSDALRRPTGTVAPAVAHRPWHLPAAAAVILLGAVGGALVLRSRSAGPTLPGIGRTIQVTRDPGLEVDPALSPDGQLVAYAAGPPTRMQIRVRQVSAGRVIGLTSDSSVNHRWPRWSPDGTRIAYQTDAGIDVVPALGGQPRTLIRLPPLPPESTTTAFTRLAGFAWSPDGARIAYAQGFAGLEVMVVPLSGGPPVRLAAASGMHSLSWSPDGTRLAGVLDNPIFVFGSAYFGNEGASSLWIIPLDGGAPTRVTEDEYLDTSPQWSPDGRFLYWVSNRGGGRDVYRIRVDRVGKPDAQPDRLTTGADAHTISLSAGGGRLAYSSFRTISNIWSMAVPSGGVASVAQARPVTGGNQTIEAVDVSPDGRWLVFDSDRNGNSDIYRMPSAGGEAVQLTTDSAGDYSPAWSRDGRRIAFHSLRTGNRDVFTMREDGTDLVRRTTSPDQDLDADWSPDGTALVVEEIGHQPGQLGALVVLLLGPGGTRNLSVSGDFAKWSPTENLIAFHGLDGLRLVSARGGDSRLLARTTAEGEPFYADWSPDGRTVYYVAKGTGGSSIRAVPVRGGPSRVLVRFDDPAREHTRYGFSTDGRRFYFTLGSHESDVWVAALDQR